MKAQAARASSVEIAADSHLHSSVGMIKEALLLADSGSVAVLGCGRCTDIPIRLLNEKFHRVDLIDIDSDALKFVRDESNQWHDAKNACRFYCADLTGMLATVESRAAGVVANCADPPECLEQLGNLLMSTPRKFWRPPESRRYDFVVCLLVLTQLQALVRESVEKIYLRRFPEHAAELQEHKSWRASIWNLARNLEDSFVEHLSALTKPQGLVYLSETVQVSWLTQLDAQSVSTEGSWITLRTSRLSDYLRPRDTIINEERWHWLREGREGNFWGRLYSVQAVFYRVP